jgi:hypothetical protein
MTVSARLAELFADNAGTCYALDEARPRAYDPGAAARVNAELAELFAAGRKGGDR